MTLTEITDDTPLVVALTQNLLHTNEEVRIVGRDGVIRVLIFITQRELDGVWVFRGLGNWDRSEGMPATVSDLRLPADAEFDSLLDIEKVDDGWILTPDWRRINELGYT